MENKYVYSISGICVLLSIWMLYIASKYVFIDNTGKFGIGVFLLGISGIIFTCFSVGNIKWKRVITTYIIGLILLIVLFFWSLPTYTYKEAVTKVESTTREKVISTTDIKKSIGHYIIYTKEGTYLFNIDSGSLRIGSNKFSNEKI